MRAAAQLEPLTPVRARAALENAEPSVHWQDGSAVEGDFEGSSPNDVAALGTSPGFAYVGLVSGETGKVALLRFARGGQAQDALCAGEPKLTSESLDYDPAPIVGVVPGFVRSKVRRGLKLSSGGCDDIHIFWDRSRQALSWWRN
ncbi:MAG TPA: hypothetical protein VNF74_13790 [Terriglobales bacterium]|nr:hypothetical protein [Terriglobales bacterium]